jgi:hypothetical protein
VNEAIQTGQALAGNPTALPYVLLIVFGGGIVWLFKWSMSKQDRQSLAMEERIEKQMMLLEGLFKEANEGRIQVAEVVSLNSERIRENTEMLNRANSTIERHS